ncbi:MAG: DUF357 domain-containing protein [Candidatus Aenigmarchaeota archaeon]|nr:DUF357 domain-containing protein [Candidatus Aenigmarchaeota archaeon]
MEKLKEETLKMLEKIEPLVDRIKITDEKGEEMLTNMKAYIADSKHFLNNKDFIKAFESVVWSWAILEICEELEVLKIEK